MIEHQICSALRFLQQIHLLFSFPWQGITEHVGPWHGDEQGFVGWALEIYKDKEFFFHYPCMLCV